MELLITSVKKKLSNEHNLQTYKVSETAIAHWLHCPMAPHTAQLTGLNVMYICKLTEFND